MCVSRYRHFNRPEKYQPAEFEAEEEVKWAVEGWLLCKTIH